VQDKVIHVIDNVLDEGQSGYRIETPSGVWNYQKVGGGFSSLVDVDGAFWLAGRDYNQNANYISQIHVGGTASWSGRVATGMNRGIRCIEGDPAGGLMVLHDDYQQDSDGNRTPVTTTIYKLVPGEASSGGGGGGNGKGKNK